MELRGEAGARWRQAIRERALRSPLVQVGALLTIAVVGITWPLALDLGGQAIDGPFWGSMAWSIDLFGDSLYSGAFPWRTRMAGWPGERELRFIGFAVLLPAALLRPVLDAATAMNLALLAGPVLSGVVMCAWLQRLAPAARPAALVLASLTYALSPHFIANLANGEVAKAQFWLVPLYLLAAERAARRWRDLPLALALGLLLALNEPYSLMVALMALPLVALFRGQWREAPRWALLALGGVGAGLAAQGYFLPPGVGDAAQVFSPARAPRLATLRLNAPFPSAPLLSLFAPPWRLPPTATQHGVYLGWTLLVLGAAGLRKPDRRAAMGAALAVAGVLGALGPVLFWSATRPAGLQLPMMLAEHWRLPLAQAGMYYRLLHLALLGLAILVARLPLRAPAALLAGLLSVGELHLGVIGGLPLAVTPLPWPQAAAAMRADPHKGAILMLPAYPRGATSKERSFRFALQHGRAITDLPRRPAMATEMPPYGAELDACFAGTGPCALPDRAAAVLARKGIRYVALEGVGAPPVDAVGEALDQRLGARTCADDLCWWTINCVDPATVAVPNARKRPTGPHNDPGPPR